MFSSRIHLHLAHTVTYLLHQLVGMLSYELGPSHTLTTRAIEIRILLDALANDIDRAVDREGNEQ